mmetsp:Transcript_100110/g.250945  ORF Transcript_100110/g.250945 Transcript_100110/m.250945 type:complete len:216 (-) Transcript_100110:389-1036(-)
MFWQAALDTRSLVFPAAETQDFLGGQVREAVAAEAGCARMLLVELLDQAHVAIEDGTVMGVLLLRISLAVLTQERAERDRLIMADSLRGRERCTHGLKEAVDLDGDVCLLRRLALSGEGEVCLRRSTRLDAQIVHDVLICVRPKGHMSRVHVPADGLAQHCVPVEGQVVVHGANAAMVRVERELLAQQPTHELIARILVLGKIREERHRRPSLLR